LHLLEIDLNVKLVSRLFRVIRYDYDGKKPNIDLKRLPPLPWRDLVVCRNKLSAHIFFFERLLMNRSSHFSTFFQERSPETSAII